MAVYTWPITEIDPVTCSVIERSQQPFSCMEIRNGVNWFHTESKDGLIIIGEYGNEAGDLGYTKVVYVASYVSEHLQIFACFSGQ